MHILRTTETGITVVQLKQKLVDLENTAKPVDYEDDEKRRFHQATREGNPETRALKAGQKTDLTSVQQQ